jgi:hypothetical protein
MRGSVAFVNRIARTAGATKSQNQANQGGV